MNTFTPTARSELKRLHERGHYDQDTLYAILDSVFLCHVTSRPANVASFEHLGLAPKRNGER